MTDDFLKAIHLHQSGKIKEAEFIYLDLLKKIPKSPELLSNLGVLYLQKHEASCLRSDFDRGVDFLNKSKTSNPLKSSNYENLCVAYIKNRNYIGALENYNAVVDLGCASTALHNMMGSFEMEMGYTTEALKKFELTISADPHEPSAWYNRGNALRVLFRLEEALVSYRRCLRLRPDYSEAFVNMGVVYQGLKQFEAAIDCYREALKLCPHAINALYNLALALENMGRFDAAVAGYTETLKLSPAYPYLVGRMHHARMQMCDWGDYSQSLSQISLAVESGFPTSAPFPFLAMVDDLQLQRVFAESYVKDKFPAAKEWEFPRSEVVRRRIRVGYFSSDFRTHAVGFLTAGLFESHNRDEFEVFALSLAKPPEHDLYTARIKAAVEHFIDFSVVPDSEAIQQLRGMGLDIAVDLSGHTMDARTGIFAQRIAPIQVNYLGYPGSMGAPYMDVILADDVLIPESCESEYSERVVRLPQTFQINDDKRPIGALHGRSHYGLPEQGLVFASFNTSYKINPPLFDIWARLLLETPGSVLWLFGENEAQIANLHREASARGVSPERLIFAGRIAYADHLARYAHVDLVLDTLPFNGGTSTSDALWGGAPVLTCMGESFAARMSASLLRAVGLSELITTSLEDYEALGKALALDTDKLAAIKAKLKANRLQFPLFDTLSQTRDIENAYREMLENRG